MIQRIGKSGGRSGIDTTFKGFPSGAVCYFRIELIQNRGIDEVFAGYDSRARFYTSPATIHDLFIKCNYFVERGRDSGEYGTQFALRKVNPTGSVSETYFSDTDRQLLPPDCSSLSVTSGTVIERDLMEPAGQNFGLFGGLLTVTPDAGSTNCLNARNAVFEGHLVFVGVSASEILIDDAPTADMESLTLKVLGDL